MTDDACGLSGYALLSPLRADAPHRRDDRRSSVPHLRSAHSAEGNAMSKAMRPKRPKRPNPNDATFRNIRALKTIVARQQLAIAMLTSKVAKLEQALYAARISS